MNVANATVIPALPVSARNFVQRFSRPHSAARLIPSGIDADVARADSASYDGIEPPVPTDLAYA